MSMANLVLSSPASQIDRALRALKVRKQGGKSTKKLPVISEIPEGYAPGSKTVILELKKLSRIGRRWNIIPKIIAIAGIMEIDN